MSSDYRTGTLNLVLYENRNSDYSTISNEWKNTLQRYNNLKKFVDEFTSEKIIKKRGIFNYDKLKIIRQLNKDRKIDASYTIFSIVCYEIWSQKFIDKR